MLNPNFQNICSFQEFYEACRADFDMSDQDFSLHEISLVWKIIGFARQYNDHCSHPLNETFFEVSIRDRPNLFERIEEALFIIGIFHNRDLLFYYGPTGRMQLLVNFTTINCSELQNWQTYSPPEPVTAFIPPQALSLDTSFDVFEGIPIGVFNMLKNEIK